MTSIRFVLLPPGASLDQLLATASPPLQAARAQLRFDCYPPAASRRHLVAELRRRRDRRATRWLPGLVTWVAVGAVVGGAVNAALAGMFDMFGGLLRVALPLGIACGALLGGLSGVMNGTETPRPELAALLAGLRPGSVLVVVSAEAREPMLLLLAHLDEAGLVSAGTG